MYLLIVKMYTHAPRRAQTHARGRAPCRRYWLRPLHSAALNTIPPLLFFSSPELLSPKRLQVSRDPCFSSGFQVTGEPPSNFRVPWCREEVGGSERSSRYSRPPAAANTTLLPVPVTNRLRSDRRDNGLHTSGRIRCFGGFIRTTADSVRLNPLGDAALPSLFSVKFAGSDVM